MWYVFRSPLRVQGTHEADVFCQQLSERQGSLTSWFSPGKAKCLYRQHCDSVVTFCSHIDPFKTLLCMTDLCLLTTYQLEGVNGILPCVLCCSLDLSRAKEQQ